ncbi:MAG: DnaB-like helicase N-terminal domain-containing protein, partial [Cellulosilyticum sp.]|nr:DnaB-like helicase N-terminal domain-containing protein [Cellulosilyticum sp.]
MATYKAEISENIVIGALMNDVNLILEMAHLKVEYFTSKVNKMLFTVIKRLFKAGSESIDIADVYALVESDKKTLKLLNDNGGMELLEILHTMGEDKSVDDVKVHVENIRKSAFKNE